MFQAEAATSMEYIGGDAVFAFRRRLFNHGGAITGLLKPSQPGRCTSASMEYISMTGRACLEPAEDQVLSGSLPRSATSTRFSWSVDRANHEGIGLLPGKETYSPTVCWL